MADKLYASMDSTEKAKSGYKSNKIVIFAETEEGVTPLTVANAYAVGVISESFDRNQRTETNTLLANGGQPSKTDTGGEDPSGSLELKRTPDWDTLLSQFVIGAYTTKTTLNDAHATDTAYALDDVVVLGGDVLVCISTGTSDSTAPTQTIDGVLLASAKTGDEILDGTVSWIITKNKTAMYEYDGQLSDDLLTAGIIFQDTVVRGSDTLIHETLGRGVSFSNMSIGKEQGMVVVKTSHSITAHGALSSVQSGYTSPTITTETALNDNAYKRDDICITIDGVSPKSTPSIMLNIDRAITIEDAVECITVAGVKTSAKLTTIGTPVISGTLTSRFTQEQFKNAFNNAEQEVVITYKKTTGEFSKYTLPKTQLLDSTKAYDTTKPINLDIPLNAHGDVVTNGLIYKIRSFLSI